MKLIAGLVTAAFGLGVGALKMVQTVLSRESQPPATPSHTPPNPTPTDVAQDVLMRDRIKRIDAGVDELRELPGQMTRLSTAIESLEARIAQAPGVLGACPMRKGAGQ